MLLTAPGLHQALRRQLGQIEARAARGHVTPWVPSHGDFRWDQFLEWRGRFSIIDFELFCQAEPSFDLGYFCAYLPPSSPTDWRDGAAAEMLRSAFLRTYAEASGAELDLERIGVCESITLATRALAYTWQHQPGWQLRASQMLDLALERLVSPELALA
ncbi:MAG TPA: phosphotransferase [Chloroflexota bacterium]|nr:phosphotransferase [Chloroflexota bacterium]